MRLPIVQYPNVVVDNLAHFVPVFHTAEQVKHFCEYVTGLMSGDKKTIVALNALYLNKNDQSALNKFLTQAAWDEKELNWRRVALELQRLQRRPLRARAGRLIIDDTLAHHTRCGIEELAYLKDHTLNRYVWAHNIVTPSSRGWASYYVNRADQFPVDLRLYLQFRPKHWAQFLQEPSRVNLEYAPAALPAQSHGVSPARTHVSNQDRVGGGAGAAGRRLGVAA